VDGPIQCSGLDIVQYNHEKMLKELPEDFKLVASEEYTHITPNKSEQKYIYFVLFHL
jgi:GMP synthase-like glutamine amidotransferase